MIRRLYWRLRITWLQKVRRRSGRFDSFNDPVFQSIDVEPGSKLAEAQAAHQRIDLPPDQ